MGAVKGRHEVTWRIYPCQGLYRVGRDARFRPAAFGQLPIETDPVPPELAGKMIQRIEEPSGAVEGDGDRWPEAKALLEALS
jgi:hypothetical protein